MSTELVKQEFSPLTFSEIKSVADAMVKSGLFSDVRSEAQAIVKILAGQEVGIGPFASMSGINLIKGKAEFGAHLVAALIKRSGQYTYKVQRMDDECVSIEFFERDGDKWSSVGVSTFTQEDAKRQGTSNIDKYPRNMLFARAMTNGNAWYCPDVSLVRVYGLGEISEEVIEGEYEEHRGPEQRPWAPDMLKKMLHDKVKWYIKQQGEEYAQKHEGTGGILGAMNGKLEELLGDRRKDFIMAAWQLESSKDMTLAQIHATKDWLEKSHPDIVAQEMEALLDIQQ